MLEYLTILRPQLIPAADELRVGIPEQTRGEFAAVGLRSGPWDSVVSAEDALFQILDRLPQRYSLESAGRAAGDDDVHDAFFHVQRVDGDRAAIFFRMIVWANWMFLRDVNMTSSRLAIEKLVILEDAFKALESWIVGETLPAAGRVKDWETHGAIGGSMHRWIRGHQIFAALTQGLLVASAALQDVVEHGNSAILTETVDLVVALLRGAGASLEFTGDIPSEDYVELIRPSMTPPLVPDSFSGLLSSDHRRLVTLLRQMQPVFAQLHRDNPDAHGRIAQALSEVYDAHRFVCERLVGKAPSLMMAGKSAESGAAQIQRFKALRMKVFEVDSRVSDSI